ncbi:hypothetical protein [Candidatus Chlorohelix sp.]|uniref:hypothetical protein n=1 Tax=Candidatus Chlorohelix sp. TaxID=3139201 RepID=UPI00302F9BBE
MSALSVKKIVFVVAVRTHFMTQTDEPPFFYCHITHKKRHPTRAHRNAPLPNNSPD